MESDKICKICGAEKDYHESGERKDGSHYDAFWGCANYRDEQHRNAKAGYKKSATQDNTGNKLIMEELAGINSRLDKLIAYVVKNLPEIK